MLIAKLNISHHITPWPTANSVNAGWGQQSLPWQQELRYRAVAEFVFDKDYHAGLLSFVMALSNSLFLPGLWLKLAASTARHRQIKLCMSTEPHAACSNTVMSWCSSKCFRHMHCYRWLYSVISACRGAWRRLETLEPRTSECLASKVGRLSFCTCSTVSKRPLHGLLKLGTDFVYIITRGAFASCMLPHCATEPCRTLMYTSVYC